MRPVSDLARLLAVSLLSILRLEAVAHGPLHEQIDALTQEIVSSPGDARLYLRRGDLERRHGDYESAMADLARAGKLDPSLSGVDLVRGKTLLAAGMYEQARIALDRFLRVQPAHAEALAVRAQTLARLGDFRAAIDGFTGAIEHSQAPDPDLYVIRARTCVAASNTAEAVRGLDEGISKLGPLASLVTAAIGIECDARRYDEAAARLGKVIAEAPRPESWLVRRAEVYEQAGRKAEAVADCNAADAAIGKLPAHTRGTRSVAELEARLSELSHRLSAP